MGIYLIAKVQKIFGFASGNGENLKIGAEKSPNTECIRAVMMYYFSSS